MQCVQCRQPLERDAAFCAECGSAQHISRLCTHCGHPFKVNQKFCVDCGQPSELTCSRCGTRLIAGQKYCKTCGQKVQEQAAHAPHICTKCGASVEENSLFCTECGSSIPTGSPQPTLATCSKKTEDGEEREKEDPEASTETVESNENKLDKDKEETDSVSDSEIQAEVTDPCRSGEGDNLKAAENKTGEDPDNKEDVEDATDKQNAYDYDDQSPDVNNEEDQTAGIPGMSDTVDGQGREIHRGQCVMFDDTGKSRSLDQHAGEPLVATALQQVSTTDPQISADLYMSTQQQALTNPQTPNDPQTVSDLQTSNDPQMTTDPGKSSDPQMSNDPHTSSDPPKSNDTQTTNDPQIPRDPQASSVPEASSDLQMSSDPQASSDPQISKDPQGSSVPQASSDLQVSYDSQASSDPQISRDPQGSSVKQVSSDLEKSNDPQASDDLQMSSYSQTSHETCNDLQTSNAPQPFTDPLTSSEPPHDDVVSTDGSAKTVGGGPVAQETEGSDPHAGAAAAAAGSCDNHTEETSREESSDRSESENEDDENQEEEKENREKDESTSQSRDNSQHREKKRNSQHQKPMNSKQRKKQKKKGKRQAEDAKQVATILFHVFISSKFKPTKSNNHRVFLCWQPSEEKPNPKDMILMDPKGTPEECGRLYEASVKSDQLPSNNVQQYKYCVEMDGKFEWEEVYFQKGCTSKDHLCRELQVSRQQLCKSQRGPWHIFDWVAYPSGMQGFRDTLKRLLHRPSSMDIFFRDLQACCFLFLPKPDMVMNALCNQVDKADPTAEDILREIHIIGQSVPFIASKDDQKFMQNCVEHFLMTPLLERLKTAVTEGDRPTGVMGTFLLCLSEKMKLRLTLDDRPIVYRALLIRPDFKTKRCPEITQLHSHFPTMMAEKEAFLKKMVSLMLDNFQDSSPSWILAVPLLHMLSGQCQPFQMLPPVSEHRNPKWWGVDQVERKLLAFKVATFHGWIESETAVYQQLSGVFEADHLMLRSFVATMNTDQVLRIFTTEDFPAEIVMASLFFHLHTNLPCLHNRKREIVDILRSTMSTVGQTISAIRQASATEKKYYTMLGAICEDLLKEVTERHPCDNGIIQAVVLLQISILTMLARPEQHSTPRNEVISGQLLYSVNNWVKPLKCLDFSQWESFIQLMEECISASQKIPNPNIADHLQNFFLDIVTSKLKELDPLTKVETCVTLMERQDSLCSVIGKYMLPYLEQALAEEQHRVEQYFQHSCVDPMKLQDLLSNLYKTRCSKSALHSKQEQLELLFTWKPMVIFLHLYGSKLYSHLSFFLSVSLSVSLSLMILQRLDKILHPFLCY